jgi:hypothetical protein
VALLLLLEPLLEEPLELVEVERLDGGRSSSVSSRSS